MNMRQNFMPSFVEKTNMKYRYGAGNISPSGLCTGMTNPLLYSESPNYGYCTT